MKSRAPYREQSTVKSIAKIVLNFVFCIALVWYGVFIGVRDVTDAINDQSLVKTGHSSTGTITKVDFKIRSGRGAESHKIFEIEYSDASDASYTYIATRPYRTAEEPGQQDVREQFIGHKVTVFYDPENPSNAVIEGWEASISLGYAGGAVVIMFSLVFLLLGVSDTKRLLKSSPNGK